MDDLISRQAAINALWKALYSYEDKTEKQFIESEDLDIQDWMLHRIFVQNMSGIDIKTILDLPSAQPEIIRCKDCKFYSLNDGGRCTRCGGLEYLINADEYCSKGERKCGS